MAEAVDLNPTKCQFESDYGHVQDLLMSVRTVENPKLKDDAFVDDCMAKLMEKYPQITDYQWERVDDRHINILMWGPTLEVT